MTFHGRPNKFNILASPNSSTCVSHQEMPSDAVVSDSNSQELLAEKILKLKKEFETLVDSIESSFINHVSLEKVQKAVKHMPVSLKCNMIIWVITFEMNIF